MAGELEDVSYLARSENRIGVLEALAAGPKDRATLKAETGASRVTVGRILAELDRRGWIVATDDGFAVTAVGRAVAEEVGRLRETLEAADVLEPMADALSPEFFPVDIRRLADAEVVRADESNPLAVARVAADMMDAADRVRVLSSAVTAETVDAQIDAASERGQVSDVVLTTGAVDAIRGDEVLAERMRTALSLDGISATVAEDALPLSMGIYDDETVAIGVIDGRSMPTATLVSEDEAVLRWAQDTFERYRDDARPLRARTFAE